LQKRFEETDYNFLKKLAKREIKNLKKTGVRESHKVQRGDGFGLCHKKHDEKKGKRSSSSISLLKKVSLLQEREERPGEVRDFAAEKTCERLLKEKRGKFMSGEGRVNGYARNR